MFRQTPIAPPMVTRRATAGTRRPATETGRQEELAAPAQTAPPPIELGPIIKAKIQPPALRSSTLSRQRLIDRLQEATSHRLTLLIAEAGYGKTTLLAEFAAQSGMRIMWYRLDATDADVVDWTNYLIAAVRELDAGFGASTVELLGEIATGGPPKEAFISSLISELADLDARPTLLVLDDFHLVEGKSAAVDVVSRLIRDAPPWLRIVLSSRRRPDLEIGRLASDGELAEISTDNLRFSREEMQSLFATAFDSPLDDEILSSVESRTRGWAASLQLFYRSAHGRPRHEIRSLARALSGATSPIYDFLAEEVLTNLPPTLEHMLVRASLLDSVSPTEAAALLADNQPPPNRDDVRQLIEEADRLGLLTRSSSTSNLRHLHPLLRDFLFRQLTQRESPGAVREMHLRVASVIGDEDPLAAARHYIEADAHMDAMQALSASLVTTIGTGRWGEATELLNEIADVPADPGVAAIRARQLMAEGDISAAAAALEGIEIQGAAPAVRAVFRHTQFALGWHTGDRELMFRVLTDIAQDTETPAVLHEIAEVYLDASSVASRPAALPALGRRLRDMADTMARQRLTYYSAIALHNSALAYLNAGEVRMAVAVGSEALERFASLTFYASEQLSTHTAMAVCEQELGEDAYSDAHRVAALASGREVADVPAELAFLSVLLGQTDRAAELITRARVQQRQNQTDTVADALLECAVAASEMRTDPAGAGSRLMQASLDSPLELGYSLGRDALLVQAHLLAGENGDARQLVDAALITARSRKARRAEVRLAILQCLLTGDPASLRSALADAERVGELALLEEADALLSRSDLLAPIPPEIDRSIRRYPRRWLPAIRRQLENGNTPNARAAAALLDSYGTLEDVGLLRAYAKTYARRGPNRNLGVALARRTSPALELHDLGPVLLSVGDRTVRATAMRRKPAAVLIYLLTRPGFAANREQVVDELWPETDPLSAANNLNQSLYFLRREIDPWYEDDVSVDYVLLQGDIVWLDRDLVRSDSSAFLAASHHRPDTAVELVALLRRYTGHFAPEFEYEEWAIAWRSRVQAAFLDLSYSATEELVRLNELPLARDVAAHVLTVDPTASDIERRLIWIYGKMGQPSSARSLYEHVLHQERQDGVDPTPLDEILNGPFVDGT